MLQKNGALPTVLTNSLAHLLLQCLGCPIWDIWGLPHRSQTPGQEQWRWLQRKRATGGTGRPQRLGGAFGVNPDHTDPRAKFYCWLQWILNRVLRQYTRLCLLSSSKEYVFPLSIHPFVSFNGQHFWRRPHFSLSVHRCAYCHILLLACNNSSLNCIVEFYLCLFTLVWIPRSVC